MKYRIAVLATILTASVAVSAASVRPFSSGNPGIRSICGKVVSARNAADLRGEPVFLTLDRAYEDQDLTVVMLDETRTGIGTPEAMVGRRICVSGRVQSFFGQPRMLLDSLTE